MCQSTSINHQSSSLKSHLLNISSGLKIVQINLQHKRNATSALVNFMEEENIDIVLVQEPYFNVKKRKIPGIPNQYNVHSFQDDHSPLAAIFIRKTLSYLPLSDLFSGVFVAVSVQTDYNRIIFASLYCAKREENIPVSFEKFLLHQNDSNNLILGADTNAHCSSFGFHETSDRKGREWEELIAAQQWVVHNQHGSPTFENSRGQQSLIDLTISNGRLVDEIENWSVDPYPGLSDHKPIYFKLTQNFKCSQRLVRNFQKVNWPKFQQHLTEDLSSCHDLKLCTRQDVDVAVDQVSKALQKNIEKFVPQVPLIQKRNLWWNSELEKIKKEIKKLKRKKQDSKLLQQEYEIKIEIAKSDAWKKFIDNAETCSDSMLRYRILCKQQQNKSFTAIKKENGEYTRNQTETASILLQAQYNDLPADSRPEHQFIRCKIEDYFKQNDQEIICPPEITQNELHSAILKMKIKKAAGPDEISPTVIPNCENLLAPLLLKIFRAACQLEYFPSSWKKAKVIFIQKPNSPPSEAKSFRPISLLSVIAKLFERILSERLWWQAEKEKWISPEQFGFRRRRSTEHALLNFTNIIETNFKRRRETLCLFADISGAFNQIWPDFVIFKLIEKNCPKQYIALIKSYLEDRFLTVETDEEIEPVSLQINQSTPQGAVLSTLLFLIVIDDLICQLKQQHKINQTVFADDIAILCHGTSRRTLEQEMNKVIKSIEEWGIISKTSFNEKKTKAMIFTHLQREKEIQLTMNGSKIELTNRFKYLGVTLDTKLSFLPHLQIVAAKATSFISKIMAVSKIKWGLTPQRAKEIYLTAILPILMYASPIWGKILKFKKAVTIIGRVHRLAAQSITGGLRTSSNEALLVVSGLTPIELMIEKRTAKFFFDIITQNNLANDLNIHENLDVHNSFPGHDTVLQWCDNQVKSISREVHDSIPDLAHRLHPADQTTFDIKIEPKEIAENIARSQHLNSILTQSIYFTDASKLKNSDVGYAVAKAIPGPDIESVACGKLASSSSVFEGEITAIHEALVQKHSSKQVWIFSDSKSGLEAICQWKETKHPTVAKIAEKLLELLCLDINVKLRWCPAHCGIPGNEKADELAKKAVTSNELVSSHINLNILIRIKKDEMVKSQQYYWERNNTGRFTYSLIPKISEDVLTLFSPFRNHGKLGFRLLLGHIPLNSYLARFKLKENPNCDICQTPETIEHTIMNCSRYIPHRLKEFCGTEPNLSKIIYNHTSFIIKILKNRFRLK